MTSSPGCRLAALGMVNALGGSVAEIWPRLIAGDGSGLGRRDDLVDGANGWYGAVTSELPEIPGSLAPWDCRNNQLALAAYEAIREPVEAAIEEHGAHRVGVVAGSSTAGFAEAEHAYRVLAETGALASRFHLAQLEFGGLPEFVSRISGATGPGYALSTACSTGAKALVSARSLLSLGICDAVIAGAVDSLCRLTANGFGALQAVSAAITNPMSAHRDGLTLGEGGALFLVTRDREGIQLLGAGESSDAHHMSAPHPEGRGAEACMRAALDDARLAPEDIAYLNLHGTGTPQNDAMEAAAVSRIFPTSSLPCSSSKPLVGHTLGASGAIEAGFCWMMLDRRADERISLPPHRYDGQRDPEIPPLNLVGEGESLEAPSPARVMTNSFGFGGSNCALVLGDAA